MLASGAFQYVCASPEEIPAALLPLIRQEIARNIGASMATLFSALAEAMPLMVLALEHNWQRPVLACKEFYGEWLLRLVCQRAEANVFFRPNIVEAPIEGPLLDSDLGMLPPRWRELYRFFGSFSITTQSSPPNVWRNTPLSLAARMPFEEYAHEIGAGRAIKREFRKRFEIDRLCCWL